MTVSIDNLISIAEATQDFLKVARIVDERGTAVILQDNAPRYILLDYRLLQKNTIADDTDVENIASSFLTKHIKAFEELAK